MTTVEKIRPANENSPNVGRLVGALLAVTVLVGGIGFVVYTGTKPVPQKVDSYAVAMAEANRTLHMTDDPKFVANAAAYQRANAAPATRETRAGCLDAIDRANYASHHQSSEAAIQASTDMLRACDAGR